MSIQGIASGSWQRSSVKAKWAVASLFLAVLLASTSGGAHAQDNPASADFSQRFYINAGVGVTRLKPESPTSALTISDSSDIGGHLGFGFDVNRFLTIEGYAADLGEADIQFLGDDVGSIGYQVFGLSAIAYLFNSRSGFSLIDSDVQGLFRREGLSIFGRGGIGHMRNSADRVDFFRDYPNHAVFGLGLEFGFESGFALRAELMGMDTDARYLHVGVLKRFGDVSVPAAVVVPIVVPEPSVPVPAVVETAEPIVPPTIYFQFDRSELTAEAQQKLDTFAAAMKDDDRTLMVEGHTDWIAPEKYNISLSVRRAEAVVNHLVAKGIDRQKMTTMGYGESRPISTNNTENGRALNRRTQIRFQ